MTTARYGSFAGKPDDCGLYGTVGLTYGVKTVTRKLTWGIQIDWDNDGFFTGENELVGLFDFDSYIGRTSFMRGGTGGFFPVDVGNLTLLYRNMSGRYDPYNPASPLYGKLLPGRAVKVSVVDEATGITHPVFAGRIKDIRPTYGETEAVKITAVDYVKELEDLTVRTGVQATIRYNEAMDLLLLTAGWQHGSVIDTTVSDTMAFYWASGGSLKDELQSLVDAVLGLMHVDEEGQLVYQSRLDAGAPLVTITGADVEREYAIQSPIPQEAVKNRARVYSRTRTAHNSVEVWRARDVFLVPAGQTREIWAGHSYNGMDAVAQAIDAPIATTDYTANEFADGSGLNRTANVAITLTAFSTATKLEVRNTGGSDFYMTYLRLMGDVITPDEFTFVEDSDADSISNYGDLLFEVKSDWLQDVNSARDLSWLLKTRLAVARRYPRFRLKPQPSLQFATRLFKLSQVDIASKGISGEYRVGYVHHKWIDEVGQTVRTELYLEPNLAGATSGTWIFPAVFGLTTIFS